MNTLRDPTFNAKSKYDELMRMGYPSNVAYQIATSNIGTNRQSLYNPLSSPTSSAYYGFNNDVSPGYSRSDISSIENFVPNERNAENDKKKLLLI
jgi:hypothetical protein